MGLSGEQGGILEEMANRPEGEIGSTMLGLGRVLRRLIFLGKRGAHSKARRQRRWAVVREVEALRVAGVHKEWGRATDKAGEQGREASQNFP